MSSRSERRRKKKSPAQGGPPPLPFGRTGRIALATVAVCLLAIGGAYLLTRALVKPSRSDQDEISALARRSIEVLPEGQWPSLYNDFTADFQGHCTLADFTKAGSDSATNLGVSLHLLEFVSLKGLAIDGTNATATIVGDLKGQANSTYETGAAFVKVNGSWKIAPASGTTGSSAFNQIPKPAPATPPGLSPPT